MASAKQTPHINGTVPTPPPQWAKKKPLPQTLTIAPVTPSTLPAYRRLISLLLPIRYSDKFYYDSIETATSRTIALCALWHDPSAPASEPIVVGGIQCRLSLIPALPSSPGQGQESLYIQTLATLAPYRYLGVGSALLEAAIEAATAGNGNGVVRDVYAHVWEANEDALEWYAKRGFVAEPSVVEGYYRKLRPSGARVVRRRVGVREYLMAENTANGQTGEVDGKSESDQAVDGTNAVANG